MNRTVDLLLRYPKTWIGTCWSLSLLIVTFVLILGDFGGPVWVFVLCGLWLLSLGLPTTLSLLILAAVWGKLPGIETPSLAVFATTAAILSLVLQTISFRAVVRFLPRREG